MRSLSLFRHSLIAPKPKSLTLFLSPRTSVMAKSMSNELISQTTPNYPKPLSPPLPLISKDIELRRALNASSKSNLFTLSRKDVLYEDDWIIAVNKPQGIYCETMLSCVPAVLDDSAEPGRTYELHLANRLDRDTSGVMLITKSHKVAAKLVKAFTDHKVRKSYIALCVGVAPEWKRITVKSGHGRSKFGAWRVYSVSDVGRVLPGGSMVRDMETSFEVLSGVNNEDGGKIIVEEAKRCMEGEAEEFLVRAFPQSGRTHQIRLHCQYLGISIRGDVKYDGVYEWKGKTYDAHELHAECMHFQHPITGLPVTVQAPLPRWATI